MSSDENKALVRRFYAEMDDGRIAEHRSDRDDLGLMQQLGVVSLSGG